MKKAFTLVELLVVIGIIAVLAGALMVTMGGGTESARAANCLTNMKGLANAAIAATSSRDGYYPLAGSVTWSYIDESQGIGKGKTVYNELTGWLSWYSDGQFPATSYKSPEYPSAYSQSGAVSSADQQLRDFAVTNGALKASISGNRELLVCPVHKIDMKTQTPFFSYQMNEYFYWNSTGKARSVHFHGRHKTDVKYPDRRLLFAEINWKGWAGDVDDAPGSQGCDQVLQYSTGECIGFNHKKGKEKCAHVAFADGHTEQILMPRRGLSDSDLQELTKLLCEGKDVVLEGDRYRELQ